MKSKNLTFANVMKTEAGNYRDILDIRDVIELFEEMELNSDDSAEFHLISLLLNDLKGYGGDEQWRGDWYPVTLIHENYFEDYARELAEDIGAIDRNAAWPNNCIDWQRAAQELEMDYSTVDFDGASYLYR